MENEKKVTSAAQEPEIIKAPFAADEEQPYIFVSYSHKDRDRIFEIITRLYEKGWQVWYDEGLEIRENYYVSLSRHIKNCEVFLLFVTENSVESKFVCEHELLLAANEDKRFCICRLDPDAQFTGEAKDAIDIVTASKKNPKTDEEGLEEALEGIEGLTRGEPRKAKGIEIRSRRQEVVVAGDEDEYVFQKCDGGVRLIDYKGGEEDVEIPEVYKGQPVVELDGTFVRNETVKTVRVPTTVRYIGENTFNCDSLTDVYIPASVQGIDEDTFGFIFQTHCTVHCAEGTYAHSVAEQADYLTVVLDESLRKTKTIESRPSEKYAFCSYADDVKEEAERIMADLTEKGCSLISSGSLSDKEKRASYRNAECLIAFLSKEYAEDEIDYLYRAISEKKNYVVYALDGTPLPPDMMTISAEQQLRYDNGAYEDRLKRLVNLLTDSGCVKPSADIPNYEYTTDTDGNIILTKYTGSDTEAVVPASHVGHKIAELRGTFGGCSSLTSVVIPDSVTTIGDGAFGECSSLTSVVIPDSVTSIGDWAFAECSSLTSVTIPDSVTSIGNSAFRECSSLTSVNIPGSVTTIGDWAFGGCEKLNEIIVSCGNNNYCSVDGVLFSKDLKKLCAYPAGHGNDYIIPDSVTTIGDWAFRECSSLTSVTIPGSVTTIGDWAFYKCRSLTSVTIPDSVTTIGDEVFSWCSSLTVYCPEGSAAWEYCDERNIPHKPLEAASDAQPEEEPAQAAPAPEPAESPANPEPVQSEIEQASAPAPKPAEVSATPEPVQAASVQAKPAHSSSSRWLIPIIILLAIIAAAVGVQLSGVFDIIGLLKGLLG